MQKVLNMKKGELYTYALFLIKHHDLINHVAFVFADVICKLWKILKKVDPCVVANVEGALSEMYEKGQGFECQVG